MDIIKRKILLNKTDKENSKLPQKLKFITFKIPLYQTIDVLGLRTDLKPSTPIYLESSMIPLEFRSQGVVSQWYEQGDKVIYASDSKLNEVKSYDKTQKYKVDFDIKKEQYRNFQSNSIDGVDRVTNIETNGINKIKTITYVLDANRDVKIGSPSQRTGTLFIDNPLDNLFLPNELDNDVTKTKVQYISEGWNKTNTSLDSQIQEEYLLGIINPPEVKSDVFIDRTTFSVLDKHLKLSEIKNLDHLTRYGNGFYNINRD